MCPSRYHQTILAQGHLHDQSPIHGYTQGELHEGVTMKNKFLALILLAFGSSAFGQVSIGIRIGPQPPPRAAL